MGVKFTKDLIAEQQALLRQIREAGGKVEWELLRTPSLVAAVRRAKEEGWADKRVQVREEKTETGHEYVVEPFEKDCGCPGMLKYEDYFLRPDEPENVS